VPDPAPSSAFSSSVQFAPVFGCSLSLVSASPIATPAPVAAAVPPPGPNPPPSSNGFLHAHGSCAHIALFSVLFSTTTLSCAFRQEQHIFPCSVSDLQGVFAKVHLLLQLFSLLSFQRVKG
jgi:hypothetical protein